MPLKEDRPHAQHVDGLRQQIVWRGRVHLQAQRLQFLDHVARIRMGDCFRSHGEVQSRQGVRRILGARERPNDVQQLFLGQPDQWTAKQRAERERVAAIGKHPGDRDEVLNLLAAKQPLAGLSGDRNAAPLQRFFIAPQIASRWREKGDVAGHAGAALAAPAIENGLAADQARTHVGNCLGFAVSLAFGRRIALSIGHSNVKGGDTQPIAFGIERIQRGEPRLAIVGR